MANEPKRIEVDETAIGVGVQNSVRFGPGTGTILRRLTNYHNIWFGCGIEPQTADANANGKWILWQKPDAAQVDGVFSDTNINAGLLNMNIIACGVWSASNQSPYNFSSQLKSSRNMVANQELVFTVRVDGITSGNVAAMRTKHLSLIFDKPLYKEFRTFFGNYWRNKV